MIASSCSNLAAFLLLLDRKIGQLQAKVEAPLPNFTWEHPRAVFPSSPEVQAFLRSSQQTFRYSKFSNIKEARVFGNRLHNVQGTGPFYQVRVVESGSGKSAKCDITKTKEKYQLAIAANHTSKKTRQKDLTTFIQLRTELQQSLTVPGVTLQEPTETVEPGCSSTETVLAATGNEEPMLEPSKN